MPRRKSKKRSTRSKSPFTERNYYIPNHRITGRSVERIPKSKTHRRRTSKYQDLEKSLSSYRQYSKEMQKELQKFADENKMFISIHRGK